MLLCTSFLPGPPDLAVEGRPVLAGGLSSRLLTGDEENDSISASGKGAGMRGTGTTYGSLLRYVDACPEDHERRAGPALQKTVNAAKEG